tara:strand:+ start:4489 stop:5301 length:813 start_codon:yes stop_codon:yes gene_type:complete
MIEGNLKNLLNQACNIAIKSGEIIEKYYKIKSNIVLKKDKSPLTQADLESNHYIINNLEKIDMTIPILSEELTVEWSKRKNWEIYWLIDPLDGTKEFLKKNDEFTVNIALIKKNKPILGVIFNPITKILYFALKNKGSYKCNIKEIKSSENFFTNSIKLKTSVKKKDELVKVISSRSHPNEKLQQWLEKNFQKFKLIYQGSSMKFCLIAEGYADLYPRFKPTSEWDIAAGHLILTEAGGKIQSIDKNEILYNSKESIINPHFIASCDLNI